MIVLKYYLNLFHVRKEDFMKTILITLFAMSAFFSVKTVDDASTLFSPVSATAENDEIQFIDHAIITTTEGLSHCDGVLL